MEDDELVVCEFVEVRFVAVVEVKGVEAAVMELSSSDDAI